ncbi:MAG: hypothetical protein EOM14_09545 [Clostridia bacterium]|nr:hypothetical protein [Clostridia bacterium]
MKRKIGYVFSGLLLLLVFMLTGCSETSESSLPSAVDEKLVSGDTFFMSELLYYSGDNFDYIDPDRRYQYADGGITVIDGLTGATLTSDNGDKAYAEVDEAAWKELFTSGLEPDISGYDQRIEYTVSDSHRIYLMDDEIWLGIFNNGTLMSLFKVSKV